MQSCTKRKCTKKDPSIIMNFVLNSFKKTNDEAIRDAINFTATIAHFIALYEHYYMDKSDDTKRLLISVIITLISLKINLIVYVLFVIINMKLSRHILMILINILNQKTILNMIPYRKKLLMILSLKLLVSIMK